MPLLESCDVIGTLVSLATAASAAPAPVGASIAAEAHRLSVFALGGEVFRFLLVRCLSLEGADARAEGADRDVLSVQRRLVDAATVQLKAAVAAVTASVAPHLAPAPPVLLAGVCVCVFLRVCVCV